MERLVGPSRRGWSTRSPSTPRRRAGVDRESLKTLAEAIGLVVLVIFVFLQSWRSTLIPAITMPVSLIGAFAFVNLLDFSINTLTLFGIVLATGIVVDDAIVVIENIERHIQDYKSPARQGRLGCDARGLRRGHRHRSRADRGVRAGRVLPGHDRPALPQFALTIAFAVALSAFNAVTLTPALSALLLDRESHRRAVLLVHRARHRRGTNVYVRRCAAGWMRALGGRSLVFVPLLGRDRRCVSRVPRRSCRRRIPDTSSSGAGPGRRVARYTDATSRRRREIVLRRPETCWRCSRSWASASAAQRLEHGHHLHAAEAVRGAAGAGAHRCQAVLAAAARPAVRHSGRDGRAVCAAVHPRAQPFGGFEFQVLDQTGTGTFRIWPGHAGV